MSKEKCIIQIDSPNNITEAYPMILFLDNKSLPELQSEIKYYQEKLGHNQVVAFNELSQVDFFIKNTEQEKYSLIVLVADCSYFCGKYSNLIRSIRSDFTGMIVAKVADLECGKTLIADGIIDEFYMEDEDKEKETARLKTRIEMGRLNRRIKKGLTSIKESIAALPQLTKVK